MSQALKERLKNLLIFILILAGILQVGILWGYQSQGSPTSFISGLFYRSAQITDAVARERIFTPDKLIASSGEKSYWILDTKTDYYAPLWKEAKQCLVRVATGKAVLRLSNEDWGDVTEKRGWIIDFGYPVSQDLLQWFLGITGQAQEVPEIVKLMVKPELADENSCIVYLYTPDKKVYVSDAITLDKVQAPEEVLNWLTGDGSQKYRAYKTLRSANIDESMNAEPDALFVSSSPKYWTYSQYSCSVPARTQRTEELTSVVLGNDRNRYNISSDKDKTVQFTYSSNIYRYTTTGYFSYQYADTSSVAKGDVGGALLKAYQFLDKINRLSESAGALQLTGAEALKSGAWSFTFDYRLDGSPVRVSMKAPDGSASELAHAVTIQSDAKRVLSCGWLMRDFAAGAKLSCSDRLTDLAPLTGRAFEQMNIAEMSFGYAIGKTAQVQLKPMLIMDMKDGATLQVELPPEKGG